MILTTQASITASILAALSGPHDTVTYPGDLFSTVLTRLAFMEQHVLIKLEFQDSEPGYLVFQRGCAVYAQHGPRSGQAALDYFYMQGSNLTLRLFALSPVVATLVFAAIEKSLVEGSGQRADAADVDGAVVKLTAQRIAACSIIRKV